MTHLRRLLIVACGLVALSAAPLARPTAAEPRAMPPSRWIAASVATLWVKPGLARPVDAPAVAAEADPRRWVAQMTPAQKHGLVGRLETQALYGERVYLLGTSGSWAKVAVAGQPTPRNSLGYPGWLPRAQLTAVRPGTGAGVAEVRRPTAWLTRSPSGDGRVLELSYGTRLPAVVWSDATVEVLALDGRHLYVPRSAVTVRKTGADLPQPAGASLVTEARRFLGLQYLWAGTSGFGFDCSGFTYAVYRHFGVSIPRDAGPQSEVGEPVARAKLRAGDLLFFRNSAGAVHHVAMYVGGGQMIHAPATGMPVAVVALSSAPYAAEYAGARRYVP